MIKGHHAILIETTGRHKDNAANCVDRERCPI